jgi:hypothetical protein
MKNYVGFMMEELDIFVIDYKLFYIPFDHLCKVRGGRGV